MWKHNYQEETDVSAEVLWPVLVDIAGWPKLDSNIDYITIADAPKLGTPFILKPKGGPKLKFIVGDFSPPHTYSDICNMPLAQMKTLHTLEKNGTGTTIKINIEIVGLLSGFWGLVVGRKHASGLPAQTKRFIAGARRQFENG